MNTNLDLDPNSGEKEVTVVITLRKASSFKSYCRAMTRLNLIMISDLKKKKSTR